MNEKNWIHLDMKGAVPDEQRLLEWLEWLRETGYDGIVWEYEDRIPWRAWPGTFRPGFTLEQWGGIWRRCEELGFEVVPLVQTLGHLEWLLKHDSMKHLREGAGAGAMASGAQVCPSKDEVQRRLREWLDEVIELHPQSQYVHVGADEVGSLGQCDACRTKAEASRHGKMALFAEHVAGLAKHVVERGKRPMIWPDMMLKHDAAELADELPNEAVLVEWQYRHPGPFETLDKLGRSGRELWGASAIRCSYPRHHTIAPLRVRLENVAGWRKEHEAGRVHGLIHTLWGRSGSLSLPYGPWEGWLSGFIAAGDPEGWSKHPLRELVDVVDAAMASPTGEGIEEAIGRIDSMKVADDRSERCRRWWALSLRHRKLLLETQELALKYFGAEPLRRHLGITEKHLRDLHQERRELLGRLDEWEKSARQVWKACALSDDEADEFVATRVGNLRYILEPEWTAGEVE